MVGRYVDLRVKKVDRALDIYEDSVNPDPATLIYLNFHPLEVALRYRDPQPQVGENYSHLFNLRANSCKF